MFWTGVHKPQSLAWCEVRAKKMTNWHVVGIWKKIEILDHGYKLGEHCDWFKHDNYEDATRIVTIIKPADGLLKNPKPPGTIIEQLAEEVDMYPSLLVSSKQCFRRLKCSESLCVLYANLCIHCQLMIALIARTIGRTCTACRYRRSYRASRGCLCSRNLPPITQENSGQSISTCVFLTTFSADLLTSLGSVCEQGV